jgi:hypothetical protein
VLDTRNVPLKNPKTNADAGTWVFDQLNPIEKPSFLQYLQAGWGISLAVAIDFTASNGDYTRSDSLHYLNGYN